MIFLFPEHADLINDGGVIPEDASVLYWASKFGGSDIFKYLILMAKRQTENQKMG